MARLVTLHDTDGEIIYPQTILEDNYSTSEQKTGATWIDGKPIYKKTINFGALPDSTTKSVAHNVSNMNNIIKIEGMSWDSSGNSTPLPSPSPGSAYSIEVYANRTNVSVYTGTDRSSITNAYITLYYTKS